MARSDNESEDKGTTWGSYWLELAEEARKKKAAKAARRSRAGWDQGSRAGRADVESTSLEGKAEPLREVKEATSNKRLQMESSVIPAAIQAALAEKLQQKLPAETAAAAAAALMSPGATAAVAALLPCAMQPQGSGDDEENTVPPLSVADFNRAAGPEAHALSILNSNKEREPSASWEQTIDKPNVSKHRGARKGDKLIDAANAEGSKSAAAPSAHALALPSTRADSGVESWQVRVKGATADPEFKKQHLEATRRAQQLQSVLGLKGSHALRMFSFELAPEELPTVNLQVSSFAFQTRPPTSVHTQPAHGISCSVGSTARGNDAPPQSLDIQCVRQHARVPSPDRAAVPLALVHIDTFALASQAVLDGELKKACLTDCLPGLIAIEEVS